MAGARVAFIGGSGLYEMDGLTDLEESYVDTPFGKPSDAIVTGDLAGSRVAFLPRHGRGHRLSPTEIPARANIYALKSLGVERIVSITAVGSLREDFRPLDVVVPDQIIDRTRNRVSTFFGDGIVAHVGFADPFCPELRSILTETARAQGTTAHDGGTLVVIEGPQFSTRAESEMYRSWGAGLIGMTALPEAKLAREAEICYASMALVTDYDTWHHTEEQVSVELIVENMTRNVETSREMVREVAGAIPVDRQCDCGSALEGSIVTGPERISRSAVERLFPIVGKYLAPAVEER